MGIDEDIRNAVEIVRVKLVFSEELITKPLIHEMAKRYDIITNIIQANVTMDEGWVILDIGGKNEEIDKALYWLHQEEVKVQLTLPLDT